MATLKTFLFDYDFDDVQLMENIIQEETGKENEVNITDQPEPEIILPTFSEDEINAAREEGFNAGKERGMTEALASIENSISQTLSSIVDEILDLSRKQSEYNEHIKIETTKTDRDISKTGRIVADPSKSEHLESETRGETAQNSPKHLEQISNTHIISILNGF